MGIVEDALNAIQEWFKGILADGSLGCLEFTCSTLNNTFSTSNKGVMKSLLSDNPSSFTGSTDASATPIWNSIETLTNNAIVPIAMFILVVILIYELIYMVINDNSFRDFDTGIFFKWSVKAVCGIMLVSNVFYIATNVFALGSKSVTSGLNTIFPAHGDFLNNTVKFSGANSIKPKIRTNLMALDIPSLLVIIFLAFLVLLVTFIVLGAIIVVLSGRMIEIFMYLSIAPIPMATMMNNDWGQVGKNWLRNILALAFQGFFIVVALTIFKTLLSNVVTQLANLGGNNVKSADIIGSMAIMLGYIVALIFTIFRSSNISKSAFAAQ